MSSVTNERRKAVAHAWKNERSLVLEGKGTRDWNKKEQRQIIETGRAKGYQGHHMKSVDGHTTKAGDANNIQFLNRKEHLEAHKGNFRNNTNGYYDPKTKKMNDFGRSKAHVEPQKLHSPLAASGKSKALANAETNKKIQAAKAKASRMKTRSVNKTKSSTERPAKAKVETRSKTLAAQRSSASKARTSAAPTKSKTLAAQRSSASSKGISAGKGISGGKSTASSGKGTSGGHTVSSGKGPSHGGH